MKFTDTACAVVALTGIVSAFPSLAKKEELNELLARQNLAAHPWQGIPPGGVRAPCPGLNTMANHGYINRNGMGITKQAMQQGFLDAFGMGFAATDAGGTNALTLCGSQTGATCNAFNLDMLNQPHVIEHDASLSRRDKEMFYDLNADNHSFNQTIWNRTLRIYGAASHLGIKFANTARIKRVQQAQGADHPGWFKENSGGSLAEHSFILSTMNDPKMVPNIANASPLARLDWLNYWITHQELPTSLGWVTPTNVITGNQINALGNAIVNAPTVTVYPGDSPYLKANSRKRSLLEVAEPEPSYFTYSERDLEDLESRGVLKARVEPSINTVAPSKIMSAQAQASAMAGAPPAVPNAYFEVLTPSEWTSYVASVAVYEEKIAGYLSQILGVNDPPSST